MERRGFLGWLMGFMGLGAAAKTAKAKAKAETKPQFEPVSQAKIEAARAENGPYAVVNVSVSIDFEGKPERSVVFWAEDVEAVGDEHVRLIDLHFANVVFLSPTVGSIFNSPFEEMKTIKIIDHRKSSTDQKTYKAMGFRAITNLTHEPTEGATCSSLVVLIESEPGIEFRPGRLTGVDVKK